MIELPEEIISKIFLYIPDRYPFLKNIRDYRKKVEYSVLEGGEYQGILLVKRLEGEGSRYVFDIVDPVFKL